MTENNNPEGINNQRYKEDKNIGVAVFILLVALTIGEFLIGLIAVDWSWPLWGIAIFKAALIIYYFMHVTRVFGLSKEDIDDNAS
jgi:hypothetical protein